MASSSDPAFHAWRCWSAIAVFATIFTVPCRCSARNELEVAHESRRARARRDARPRARPPRGRSRRGAARGLREEHVRPACANIVERLDLRKALADENTLAKLSMAGFRGQTPLTLFLFFRLVLPFVCFVARRRLSLPARRPARSAGPSCQGLPSCVVVAYVGFYAPNLYVTNRDRQAPAVDPARLAGRARPDADLRRIRHVDRSARSARSPTRSASSRSALAEELVLTKAELSYLQERRKAYENLAARTGLDGVKSVTSGADPGRALRHAARHRAARAGAGKPRHAHERGREEGRRPAAEADRADDPVLPAGAVRRHPRPGRCIQVFAKT